MELELDTGRVKGTERGCVEGSRDTGTDSKGSLETVETEGKGGRSIRQRRRRRGAEKIGKKITANMEHEREGTDGWLGINYEEKEVWIIKEEVEKD